MIHTLFPVKRNIYSKCSSNSEAFASELLYYVEEMFPCYYAHTDLFSIYKHNSLLLPVEVRVNLFATDITLLEHHYASGNEE